MTTATAAKKTTSLPKDCLDIDYLPLEVAGFLAKRVAATLNPYHGKLIIQVVRPANAEALGLGAFHVIDEYVDFKGNIRSESVVMSLSIKARPVLVQDETGRTKTGWEVWMKKPKDWEMITKVS